MTEVYRFRRTTINESGIGAFEDRKLMGINECLDRIAIEGLLIDKAVNGELSLSYVLSFAGYHELALLTSPSMLRLRASPSAFQFDPSQSSRALSSITTQALG